MSAGHGSSALAFQWGQLSHHANSRTYYNSFTLQHTQYELGSLVYLLPEEPGAQMFIGRLIAAFIDNNAGACSIEVRCRGGAPQGPPADARQKSWATAPWPFTRVARPRQAAVISCMCPATILIQLPLARPRYVSRALHPMVTDLQHPHACFPSCPACPHAAHQVRWFERLPNQEVVELEETDVNPAGCLAGIAPVVFAASREQVRLHATSCMPSVHP